MYFNTTLHVPTLLHHYFALNRQKHFDILNGIHYIYLQITTTIVLRMCTMKLRKVTHYTCFEIELIYTSTSTFGPKIFQIEAIITGMCFRNEYLNIK